MVKQFISFFVGFTTIFLGAGVTLAQPSALPDREQRGVFSANFGFNASLVTSEVGAGWTFSLPSLSRDVLVFTSFSSPIFRLGVDDGKFSTAAYLETYQTGNFSVPISLGGIGLWTNNGAFRAVGLATEVGMFPGWYKPSFLLAGEISWLQTWGAHLTHSESFRELINPEVEDGWYAARGTTIRTGIRFGLPLSKKHSIDFMMRAGYEIPTAPAFDAIIPPLYLTVGANVRFGRPKKLPAPKATGETVFSSATTPTSQPTPPDPSAVSVESNPEQETSVSESEFPASELIHPPQVEDPSSFPVKEPLHMWEDDCMREDPKNWECLYEKSPLEPWLFLL